MPLSINTNIASMTAQRSFLDSNAALETAFERLATGKRVNSASDDAAGLAIGKDLEARVSGLNQAVRNVNDGISMVQIAEGALDEVNTILQKMRDLAVQASNDSLSSTERGYIDTEQAKLSASIDEAVAQAKFNSTALFTTGSSGTTSFTIQDGADNNETMSITTTNISSTILGVGAGDIQSTHASFRLEGITDTMVGLEDDGSTALTVAFVYGSGGSYDADDATVNLTLNGRTTEDVAAALNASDNSVVSRYTYTVDGDTVIGTADASGTHDITTVTIDGAVATTTSVATGSTVTAAGTNAGIQAIDDAMAAVALNRSGLGATQAQLESTVRNLTNVAENTAAAASRIMDTDYAAETANLTKAQILQQAATSVLAQANAQPQAVLALLQ